MPGARRWRSGAVDDASETIVQVALFLIAVSVVNIDVDIDRFSGAGPDTRLLIGIGVALLLSAAVLFAVPKVRKKVVPEIQGALAGVWSVARVRRKRVELSAGTCSLSPPMRSPWVRRASRTALISTSLSSWS